MRPSAEADTSTSPSTLPLSTHTSCAEAAPADVLAWSGGRALVATGAPFAPVSYEAKTVEIAQVNNFYIFPGVGQGVATTQAALVTDRMLLAAARTLGDWSPAIASPDAPLLPPIEHMPEAAVSIAVAVGKCAIEDGLTPAQDPSTLESRIRRRLWRPAYPRLIAE